MARKQLIQKRRDTAENWTSVNPVLSSGEEGFETDTRKSKVGDGSTSWNLLQYVAADSIQKVFNVKDYGAAGNGTNDDTSSIQSAIEAAEVTGGIVFIPQGRYKVNLPQITSGNIIIEGAGRKSELVLADATLNPLGTTIGLWINGASNVIVRNIAIDGNFANIAKDGDYLDSSPLWDEVINKYGEESVKNYQYGSSGGIDYTTYLQYSACLRITSATNVIVEGCYFHDSKSSGVLIDSDTVDGTQEIIIRNNRVKMVWDNGIYFHRGVRYGSAIGNHCSDSVYSGITSIYNNDINIANNVIHDTGPSPSDSSGIEICSGERNIVSNNNIKNVLYAGILLKNSDETNLINGHSGEFTRNYDTTVSGNNIESVISPDNVHIGHGIHVRSSDRTNVIGNQIRKADYGISVDDVSDSTNVRTNLVDSCKGWGIYVGNHADVTNTIIDGNTIQNGKDHGVCSFAPVVFTNNIVRNNAFQGLSVEARPTGTPYKTDVVRNNIFADNGWNGIGAMSGSGNRLIIRDNRFINSDYRTFEDGVVTKDSTTFTANSYEFTNKDIGSIVVIPSAGSANGNDTLVTSISSINNSHSVELAAQAKITRSNLSFTMYLPKNIYYDGSMSSGSAVLTSNTANFTSDDSGKKVILYSKNKPNPSVLGEFTISSVTSKTQATLNASPMNESGVMFAIIRNLGNQERAVYVANNTDIQYENNHSVGMSIEDYNFYDIGPHSVVRGNYDIASNRTFGNPNDPIVTQLEAVNYTRYLGAKDTSSGIDASGGERFVYLPDISTVPSGEIFIVFKTDSSVNNVVVQCGKLNGVTDGTVNLKYRGDSIIIISAGSSLGYFTIANNSYVYDGGTP